uniref:Putative ovule protein n=1 Tax=Solanum chacoense TaxID=4108 RepID=A0A0V0IG93_SOLCH
MRREIYLILKSTREDFLCPNSQVCFPQSKEDGQAPNILWFLRIISLPWKPLSLFSSSLRRLAVAATSSNPGDPLSPLASSPLYHSPLLPSSSSSDQQSARTTGD